MKRLLLIGCLFAAFACTKEPAELSGGDSGPTPPRIVGTPTSGLALKGAISIKLTPEMAQTVATAQAQLPATRGGAVTRSGVGTIDDLLNEIGAEHFERIITYNPEWEAIYDETGINVGTASRSTKTPTSARSAAVLPRCPASLSWSIRSILNISVR